MIIPLPDRVPTVAESAWLAPTAVLVGAVELHEEASVWFGAVVRADGDRITIGAQSNVQDGCVLHTDPGHHLVLGSRVSVGHAAVLHGCTVGDDALIGMRSVVMNGAVIGEGSIVGAGAVVPEGMVVPPGSLVLGVPGKVREGRPEQRERNRINAHHYTLLMAATREATSEATQGQSPG